MGGNPSGLVLEPRLPFLAAPLVLANRKVPEAEEEYHKDFCVELRPFHLFDEPAIILLCTGRISVLFTRHRY